MQRPLNILTNPAIPHSGKCRGNPGQGEERVWAKSVVIAMLRRSAIVLGDVLSDMIPASGLSESDPWCEHPFDYETD
jgi:hypothetical protein